MVGNCGSATCAHGVLPVGRSAPAPLKCRGILAPGPEARAGREPAEGEVGAAGAELEDGEIVRRDPRGRGGPVRGPGPPLPGAGGLARRADGRATATTRSTSSQEIFLKVFQALDRFNPAYKFSTWLFRIAGNAAIDHLRKRRPRTVPLEMPDPEGGAGALSRRAALDGLDPYGELRNVERGRPSPRRSRSCRRTSGS